MRKKGQNARRLGALSRLEAVKNPNERQQKEIAVLKDRTRGNEVI